MVAMRDEGKCRTALWKLRAMKSAQDNCGVFGLYSSTPCVLDIYQGIDFLQHRGQKYCGLSVFDGKLRQVTHHGQVRSSFNDREIRYLRGNWGIGHVSLKERQPVKWQSNFGEIAVAFSGNVLNANELIREMMSRGKTFFKSYDVEILSKIILEAKNPLEGLTHLPRRIDGA